MECASVVDTFVWHERSELMLDGQPGDEARDHTSPKARMRIGSKTHFLPDVVLEIQALLRQVREGDASGEGWTAVPDDGETGLAWVLDCDLFEEPAKRRLEMAVERRGGSPFDSGEILCTRADQPCEEEYGDRQIRGGPTDGGSPGCCCRGGKDGHTAPPSSCIPLFSRDRLDALRQSIEFFRASYGSTGSARLKVTTRYLPAFRDRDRGISFSGRPPALSLLGRERASPVSSGATIPLQ
jgi:hypothetical protein